MWTDTISSDRTESGGKEMVMGRRDLCRVQIVPYWGRYYWYLAVPSGQLKHGTEDSVCGEKDRLSD